MKAVSRYLFPGFIICIMVVSCSRKGTEKKTTIIQPGISNTSDVADPDTFPRANITFILGKDENTRNPYYSLASQYYRLSKEKTEIVIDTMVSLLEVRDFLDAHRPENGQPWGLINLVSHGNEFIDLSVWVTPTGARVSEESLQEAIADNVFKPLDSLVIDKKTLFHLHGCGAGNNAGLLNFLGIAFGGKEKPARVTASRMFEYYAYTSPNKDPQSIQHYYARVWYAFYRVDSVPDKASLAEQLKTRYPGEDVDWTEAVYRQDPLEPSEAYHMNLKIPIVWEDFYENKEELPDLGTRAKQVKWLENKTEFRALMKKTGIPKEYFRIKFYTLVYNRGNDTFYSSKVKGMAGVICVIKPEVREDKLHSAKYIPYVPSLNDDKFFGFSRN